MGYAGWVGKTDEENSVLVSLLENAGAVFYVKTSVPQSLMTCETINNVFGRTVNPRNKNWAPGGSSGGEGAILGFRGSVLGVGTDIGMSDIPTMFHPLRDDVCSMLRQYEYRWIHPCTGSLQLFVRRSSQPWSLAIRQDGQQYGRAGDNSQCLRTSWTLRRGLEAPDQGRSRRTAMELRFQSGAYAMAWS